MSVQSFIYLIEAENGLVKIGKGQRVEDRVQSVRLHSPVRCRLIAAWPGDAEDERTLHEHFASARDHGEWFRLEGGFSAYVESRRGLSVPHIPDWLDLAFDQRGNFVKQRTALARSGLLCRHGAPGHKRARHEIADRCTGLTPRLSRLLGFIAEYNRVHGCSPSYQEMIDELGLASKSAAHRMIACLVERGHVERLPHLSRTVTLTDAGKAFVTERSRYTSPQLAEVRVA